MCPQFANLRCGKNLFPPVASAYAAAKRDTANPNFSHLSNLRCGKNLFPPVASAYAAAKRDTANPNFSHLSGNRAGFGSARGGGFTLHRGGLEYGGPAATKLCHRHHADTRRLSLARHAQWAGAF